MSTDTLPQTRNDAETWTGVFQIGTTPMPLRLTGTGEALTGVHIFAPSEAVSVSDAPPASGALRETINQLKAYFAGDLQKFDLPLRADGTPFQQKVWKANRQIPYGQTRSYWWVAVRIGDPHSVRAVGGALGANPIPIIIPCHRVVRSDGALGGFSSGLEWKKVLLSHEAGASLFK
ncbi:MAG: methylated-DNA--[protein]-cysteine S-methyltransferase [Candidatus Sumerlaeaceae bacterium]|nr:methylated-DNA--[protein]-cysteine S-methyltransferase [Candidatus Sumerlaeaceae bacterium]